jgi:tRNA (mo5U34)-methyltransferase
MNLVDPKLLPHSEQTLAHTTPHRRADIAKVLTQALEKLKLPTFNAHFKVFENLADLLDKPTLLEQEDRWVKIFTHEPQSPEMSARVLESLKVLRPWRKGPFRFMGVDLEAEWDSDLKWQRLAPHLGSLWGKKVLDVGCNNGYYLLRIAQQDPAWALGIDPTPRFYLQWKMLTAGLNLPRCEFQMLGIEHCDAFPSVFDVIFCMGIIYHHPDPIGQLNHLRTALKPGGWLVLEGMGIDHPESYCLFPETRYAKAPGVWFLPSLSCLENWLKRAGFRDIRVLDSRRTESHEQRNSPFCPKPFETLEDFLDPQDPLKTVEGYPAPHRHMILAR